MASDIQEYGCFFAPERREAEPLEILHLARDREQIFDTCAPEGVPEEAVARIQGWPWSPAFEHGDLPPEGEDIPRRVVRVRT